MRWNGGAYDRGMSEEQSFGPSPLIGALQDYADCQRYTLRTIALALGVPESEFVVDYPRGRCDFWQAYWRQREQLVFNLIAVDPRIDVDAHLRSRCLDDARKLHELAELYRPRRGTLFSTLLNPRRGRPRRK